MERKISFFMRFFVLRNTVSYGFKKVKINGLKMVCERMNYIVKVKKVHGERLGILFQKLSLLFQYLVFMIICV
jgi:hypothetical protein